MVHMLLSMDNMHGILRQLYTDMMTLCESMTSVASGIAGLRRCSTSPTVCGNRWHAARP